MADSNNVIFKILADTKAYTEGMAKTVDVTEAATDAMKIGFAALAATAVGAGVAFAKFEEHMANLAVVSGDSADEVKKMGDEIVKLSTTTSKPIGELVDAMTDIRDAGVSSADAMGTLKAAAKLASTTMTPLKDSANIIATSLNAFASEGLSAAEAANILFKAAQYGRAPLKDLAAGFGDIAPVLKSTGISFREYNASVSAMTNLGISASTAQSGLRAAMIALSKPTKEMQMIFRQLGYKDMNDLMNNSKNLGDAFAKVRATAEKLGIPLVDAAGRGAMAFQALTDVSKEYNAALADMSSGVDKITEAYKIQEETLMAQKQIMINMINAVFINLGSKMQPALIEMGAAFIDTFKIINDAITKNGSKITEVFKYILEIGQTAFSAIKDLGAAIANIFQAFGGYQIVAAATVVIKYFIDAVAIVASVVKTISAALVGMLNDFGALGTVMKVVLGIMALYQASAMAGAIIKIVEATKLWKAAMFALNLVMKANPIALIATAVIALGAVVYDIIVNFNEWRLSFSKLVNNIMIGWTKLKMLMASDETKVALQKELDTLNAQNASIEANTAALKARKEELKNSGASSFAADKQAGAEMAAGTLAPATGAAAPEAGVVDNSAAVQANEDKKTAIVAQSEQERINIKMNAAVQEQVMMEENNAAEMALIETWYADSQAKEEERYAAEQEALLARRDEETMSDEEYRLAKEALQDAHYLRLQAQTDQYWKQKNEKTKKQDTFEYTMQKQANDKVKAMQDGMYSEFKDTLKMYAEQNKGAAKAYQALSIAEAIVSTYLGASKALGSMPFPANIAAAALITAQGLMTVAKIKQQSFAVGTDYVPQDMLASIHSGEGIIPAKENQFLQSGKLALVSPDMVGAGGQTNTEEQAPTYNTAVSFDGANIYGDVDESMSLKIADKIASAIHKNRFSGFPAPAK